MSEFEKRVANSLSTMNWWLYCIFFALCWIVVALMLLVDK
jgi:preprotein translocase subunit SecG